VIPALISEWLSGSDVVYARRIERHGEKYLKRKSADLFYTFLGWMSDTKLPRDVGDFRLMDRTVVNEIKALPERSLYLRGLVSWVGFKQTEVLYERDPRFAGETKYSLRKMANLATDAVVSFSEKPLRVVTQIGFFVTGVSFMAALFFVVTALLSNGNLVPGWLSVIVTILLLGGVQLICLGIVGAYINRVFREVKGRPIYIIDERKSR
jgi:dolichol-phosphate mannosyltransferase